MEIESLNRPRTQVVMLGTGTPRPDPARSGPAVGILVDGKPYLVDCGPGIVRRVMGAYERNITGFGFGGVHIHEVFITHLHCDHTMGLPDLLLTPWLMGRCEPLTVYGPEGSAAMAKSISEAWRLDIHSRVQGINQRDPRGSAFSVKEISEGFVMRDDRVEVTAFRVRHEEMADSFGYRFETADRMIVISGDTAPCDQLVIHARGCDVLVHDVYSIDDFHNVSPQFQEFRTRHHTSSIELAEIANVVRPGLLVLTHRGGRGAQFATAESDRILLSEISARYDGPVVAARDLDVF